MFMPVRSGIHLAETDEERQAVYRFRYDVYVQEMGRYRGVADHEERLLVEPEDDYSRIFYAARDGEVVGTSRFTWGGDGPFSARQIEQYHLAPFLAELPPEAMVVGERGMVAPHLRGSGLFREMGRETRRFVNDRRIQLIFGACEPHLLSLYLGRGARTYAKRNVNSPEAGYLIPIVTVVEDVDYLRRIGSPDAESLQDFGADARVPECVGRLITGGGSVMSHRLTEYGSYFGEIQRALSELAESRFSALDGLTAEEAARWLGKSNIIECSAGDRVLKKGGVARNMFVVLDGTLEVRDGETVVRALGPGEVFGEMAFLLQQPRSMDVYAATDGVRVLSLSERMLRQMIDSDAQAAAKLLLNISKMLCLRLLRSS
jgi:hypothetical protein